jgi:hypothetical protein
LGRLHAAILSLNSLHQLPSESDEFKEYVGVMHVHSFLGGHSAGTFQELIAAASGDHLNFVLMTEHTAAEFDTAAMTLKGVHESVLFVNGNEVVTQNGDRLLLLPGDPEAAKETTENVLAKHEKDLTVIPYPTDFKTWNAKDYDGIEIYNLYSNAKRINALIALCDALWSYRSYPDLMFATFFSRPDENLQKWDEQIAGQGRGIVATAGNDAHSNVGISLNDSSGKILAGIKLDPYERSFRLVRMHVLMGANETLSQESLLSDIAKGHCFIGFDIFGDSSGFRFKVATMSETKSMGDEVKLDTRTDLSVYVPIPARIVLFKDGAKVDESVGVREMKFAVKEKGSYRVEIYLSLPKPAENKPWIISNPIYIR